MSKTAPYGTWESPITTEALTAKAVNIPSVFVDPVTREIYHVEGRPSESGRSVIVYTREGRDINGPGFNARTGVHEYGGAAELAYDGVVYFSNYADGRIYRIAPGGEPVAVTPAGKPYRFADFQVNPTRPTQLIGLLEDHTVDTPAGVTNSLVVIDLDTGDLAPLTAGADFYGAPRLSPDGAQLAWTEWRHPDMPWEGAQLFVAPFDADARTLGTRTHIAGTPGEAAAACPFWSLDGRNTLYFVCDAGAPRFRNPWVYAPGAAARPLLRTPLAHEFGAPGWQLGFEAGVPLDQRGECLLFVATKDGRSVWHIVDVVAGRTDEIASPYVVVVALRRVGDSEVVFTGRKVDEPLSAVRATISEDGAFTYETLKLSTDAQLPPELISRARPITLRVPPDDAPLYVNYYPPTNPEYAGSSIPGEKPPCIFGIHGGPTNHAPQGLELQIQYFTSRGWAWVDVNYGGSSGYGRDYTDRLAGNWGVVDVQDTIEAALRLSTSPHALVDPARMCVRGRSAGGYTTLAVLCDAARPGVFAAGTSLFGISDLAELADDMHKFESHYFIRLLGGTPVEAPDVYRARSPVFHAAWIERPLLILQGAADTVVVPRQAELIVGAIRARGGAVEHTVYEGEGHGWRKAETIRDALERELAFYERTLGIARA